MPVGKVSKFIYRTSYANIFKLKTILFFFSSNLGGRCATTSLHFDPDHPQQMAPWLGGGRGRRVFTSCINVCMCVSWLTHAHCAPLYQAVCGVFDKSVRTLLHDFGPMVPQLGEMLGEIYSAFPQASALDLARQVHLRIHRPELKYYSSDSDTDSRRLRCQSLCFCLF